jgi:hypothetical protein
MPDTAWNSTARLNKSVRAEMFYLGTLGKQKKEKANGFIGRN